MQDPHFFGYGSLVNRRTHGYAPARTAAITGWRRRWSNAPSRPVALLTAHPVPGARIDGLIAPVPGGDWRALDAREAAYVRTPTAAVEHTLGPGAQVAIYAADPTRSPSGAPLPILQSYLDVVVQGYLREFGEAGVARFFETTDGWDRDVAADRADPVYPRAQTLTPHERRLADTWTERMGARTVAPHRLPRAG